MPGVLCAVVVALSAHAQFPSQKTWCNPIDVNYKYNFEQRALMYFSSSNLCLAPSATTFSGA
jgi:hypothetical protein